MRRIKCGRLSLNAAFCLCSLLAALPSARGQTFNATAQGFVAIAPGVPSGLQVFVTPGAPHITDFSASGLGAFDIANAIVTPNPFSVSVFTDAHGGAGSSDSSSTFGAETAKSTIKVVNNTDAPLTYSYQVFQSLSVSVSGASVNRFERKTGSANAKISITRNSGPTITLRGSARQPGGSPGGSGSTPFATIFRTIGARRTDTYEISSMAKGEASSLKVVPEPASIVLFSTALIPVAVGLRRRSKGQASER